MSVIGLDVPHAHVHLLPIQKASDVSPSTPRRNWTKEDFEAAQQRIIAATRETA
jgi:histidine triad (HIT) family protein